jgi:hypothetical protein
VFVSISRFPKENTDLKEVCISRFPKGKETQTLRETFYLLVSPGLRKKKKQTSREIFYLLVFPGFKRNKMRLQGQFFICFWLQYVLMEVEDLGATR